MASRSEKGVLVKALKKADAILKEMVSMTLRSNLTRIQRISLETCITVHMHQKESTGEVTWPLKQSLVSNIGDMHHRTYATGVQGRRKSILFLCFFPALTSRTSFWP